MFILLKLFLKCKIYTYLPKNVQRVGKGTKQKIEVPTPFHKPNPYSLKFSSISAFLCITEIFQEFYNFLGGFFSFIDRFYRFELGIPQIL